MKTIAFFLLLCISSELLFSQEVSIELHANGFNDPLNIANTGVEGDERLFVVEQGGKIKILYPDGTIEASPFLDISGQISSGGERGLLGLAFHPDFETNGYLFVNYTDTDGDTQVSRFTVDANDPNLADGSSELPIIDYEQPFSNHNGGDLAFGPAGYLFISSGDGGGGGDPGNRAQDLGVLLGKILRIDIDNPSNGENYGIPTDNPFLENPNAREEIWAYGLRNPWRFSFDFVGGNIWIGDVGQGNVEEIDSSPISMAGLNYGWRCYEGSDVFNPENCPPDDELVFPFAEYSSASGSGNCSITGGYVYRGSVYSDIQELYFYADYCSGLIGTVDASGTILEHGNFGGNWVSFGEDVHGELYIVDLGGSVHKINGGTMSTTSHSSTSVSIFPNPASDQLIVEFRGGRAAEITIFDLSGKKLFRERNINPARKIVPVSSFSKGIYLIRIELKNGETLARKFLIK